MMARNGKKELVLESLEPRCLLNGYWEGIDVDGDIVGIELVGPGELFVDSELEGLGERVEMVTVEGTAGNSRLWVWTEPAAGGDGLVEIGAVEAGDEVLREIVAQARIGDLTVGSVKLVEVYEAGDVGGLRGLWTIGDGMRELYVAGVVEEVDISVLGPVGRVTVEGDMVAATLAVDGRLGRMNVWGSVEDSELAVLDRVGRVAIEGHMLASGFVAQGNVGRFEVWGDMAEDAYLGATGRIGQVLVGGYLDASTVETVDRLGTVYVGMDLMDSTVYGEWGVGRVIVDGSIVGSVIESGLGIRVIDAWEWVEETDIIAGRGVGRLLAYNVSDVNVDAPRGVRSVWLDAYSRDVYWDNLYVVVDTGWYWPVYDVEYVDVVYVGGTEVWYYDPYYWDVYYDGGYYYDDWYYDPYYWDAGGYYDWTYYDYYYDVWW